jgi:hypothetical protein
MNRRIVTAYLVSPAGAVVVVFLLIAPMSLSAALLSAGICAAVSYPVALVFGIPGHCLLIKADIRTSIGYVASGFVLGAVVPTTLFLFIGETIETATEYVTRQLPGWGLIAGAFGLLGALNGHVFWRLVRPDRQAVEGT